MPHINIAIIDEHPVFIAGLMANISAEPDMQVVGHARSTTQLPETEIEEKIDVLLLDMNHGNRMSLDGLPDIRERHPDMKIILVTGDSMNGTALQMELLQAESCLGKHCPFQDIASTIRQLYSENQMKPE